MQPRRTSAFHFYLCTSGISLLCQSLFVILGIGEPSRLDALGRNGCTTANSESVWTLQGAANVPVNVSKRLTHYMTVSSIAFVTIFVFRPHPHMHRPEGFGPIANRTFFCGERFCIRNK